MMGIGFPELMIILVIIMIIFGAGKLPEIGSAFGNSIRNFKKSMKEVDEAEESTKEDEAEESTKEEDTTELDEVAGVTNEGVNEEQPEKVEDPAASTPKTEDK
jgi:sec-independent protein translocase protein TatA